MKIINILGLAIVMLLSLTACGSKGILVETMEEEGTEAVFGEISANASDSDAADTEDVVASEDTITVYVCGAVVREGVYELPAGSRISDALLMAGGYDENALHGYVNLAERLEAAGVSFSAQIPTQNSTLLSFIISWILPVALFSLLGKVLMSQMSKHMGGGINAMSFGKSNAKIVAQQETGADGRAGA